MKIKVKFPTKSSVINITRYGLVRNKAYIKPNYQIKQFTAEFLFWLIIVTDLY